MKSRNISQIKPYAYFITRLADDMKYVGIRLANVKYNRTPEEDFGKYYFTSGDFKEEFKKFPDRFKIRICYCFDSNEEAARWEYGVLLKIFKRPSWANKTAAFKYTDFSKVSPKISAGKRAIKSSGKTSIEEGAEKLKEFLYQTAEGAEIRANISKRKKKYWEGLSNSERNEISAKRKQNMDFHEASKKASETMRVVGSDGLTTLQRKARKAVQTRKAKGYTGKEHAKNMNDAINAKYGSMTDEEFEAAIKDLTPRSQKGLSTRRNKYLQALSNEQC